MFANNFVVDVYAGINKRLRNDLDGGRKDTNDVSKLYPIWSLEQCVPVGREFTTC